MASYYSIGIVAIHGLVQRSESMIPGTVPIRSEAQVSLHMRRIRVFGTLLLLRGNFLMIESDI